MSELADVALAYAEAGWEVFPLRGKVPAIPKADGGKGVLDATTDLEQVAAWWHRMPDANIGGRVPEGVARPRPRPPARRTRARSYGSKPSTDRS